MAKFYNLESSVYPSSTNAVQAMNSFIQERHNDSEICITVDVYRGTLKIRIHLANEESGPAIFSTDLAPISGSDVSKVVGVLLMG